MPRLRPPRAPECRASGRQGCLPARVRPECAAVWAVRGFRALPRTRRRPVRDSAPASALRFGSGPTARSNTPRRCFRQWRGAAFSPTLRLARASRRDCLCRAKPPALFPPRFCPARAAVCRICSRCSLARLTTEIAELARSSGRVAAVSDAECGPAPARCRVGETRCAIIRGVEPESPQGRLADCLKSRGRSG